jgi:hypothetical protein
LCLSILPHHKWLDFSWFFTSYTRIERMKALSI